MNLQHLICEEIKMDSVSPLSFEIRNKLEQYELSERSDLVSLTFTAYRNKINSILRET